MSVDIKIEVFGAFVHARILFSHVREFDHGHSLPVALLDLNFFVVNTKDSVAGPVLEKNFLFFGVGRVIYRVEAKQLMATHEVNHDKNWTFLGIGHARRVIECKFQSSSPKLGGAGEPLETDLLSNLILLNKLLLRHLKSSVNGELV